MDEGGKPSDFRGHVDSTEPVFSGWLSDVSSPHRPVRFWLSIDRQCRVPVTADRPRPDVAAAGLAGANCGFAVELPSRFLDGAEHELALSLDGGARLNLPGGRPSVALGPVQAELVPPSAVMAQDVLDLLRRTHSESGLNPDRVRLEHAAGFNAIGSPGRGFVLYGRSNNRLVGYSRLDRGQGEMAHLGVVALTVLAAYRRKGIGEALMRGLMRAASEHAVQQVWLAVRPDNTPARRLYEKIGFVPASDCPAGAWVTPGDITMVWLSQNAGTSF